MKKGTPEYTKGIKRYCDAMAAKKGSKEALRMSGFKSHMQPALAWYADDRNPNHVKADSAFPTDQAKADLRVAELRNDGMSWGQIVVIGSYPNETQVRNAFGRATGLAAEGLRKNRGGRFLKRDGRFYQGNRKGMGYQHEVGTQADPEKALVGADKATDKIPDRIAKAKGTAKARVRKPRKAVKKS